MPKGGFSPIGINFGKNYKTKKLKLNWTKTFITFHFESFV